MMKELPGKGRKATVYVHPIIAELLYSEKEFVLKELEKKFGKKVVVKTSSTLHQEQYEIV